MEESREVVHSVQLGSTRNNKSRSDSLPLADSNTTKPCAASIQSWDPTITTGHRWRFGLSNDPRLATPSWPLLPGLELGVGPLQRPLGWSHDGNKKIHKQSGEIRARTDTNVAVKRILVLYGLPSWACGVELVNGIQWSAPILRPSP